MGDWHICVPYGCGVSDGDWGADSLTYALWFRWSLTQDPTIPPLMAALNADGPTWGSCTPQSCPGWSDVPMWDSIAASREYQVTGDVAALTRAEDAFNYLDQGTQFGIGACPTIDYQQPGGGGNQLKTLESDSNYVKAALLLYEVTKDPSYISRAATKYQAIRQYFLDPVVPLYSVYVFDTGTACTQLPHRFFGSVNGNMIWSGVELEALVPDAGYLGEALASAQAVAADLSDASGLYADLQAENDITEPMVEAMYRLATERDAGFARDWLTTNAAASAGDRTDAGTYGRFWNGPAPEATITEWQSTGGLALAFAAADLLPSGIPSADVWADAGYVADDLPTLPSSITFTGSAIALIGTIGEQCCESGHAQVFIDGIETFDQTGIWQNKSSSGQSLPNSVLFAWRWPSSGTHTLDFEPGVTNGKEGTAFLHIQGYYLVP